MKITRFDENASEIETSIKEKNGKRALYYDINMTFVWEGKSRLGRHKDNYGKIEGIYRMYNIGQDTKFELGGDRDMSRVRARVHAAVHRAERPVGVADQGAGARALRDRLEADHEVLIPAVESKAELVK